MATQAEQQAELMATVAAIQKDVQEIHGAVVPDSPYAQPPPDETETAEPAHAATKAKHHA